MRRAIGFVAAATLASSLAVVLPDVAQAARGNTGSGRWARAYCEGSADWIDALRGRVGAIAGKGGTPPDPGKVKAAIVRFFKAAVRSTKRFESRLRKAGHPDVPHGTKIAEALTDGLADARRGFARARADAARLTTTDALQVQAGADAAQATLDEELAKVGAGVDRVARRFGSAALGDVLHGEAACRAFLPPAPTTTTAAA